MLRDEQVLSHPQPDLVLQEADTLVLVGDHAAVEVALLQLEKSAANPIADLPEIAS